MALHPDPETNKLLGKAAERLAFDIARPRPVVHVFERTGNDYTYVMLEDPITGQRHYGVGSMLFREMEHRLNATYRIELRQAADVRFHRRGEDRVMIPTALPISMFPLDAGALPEMAEPILRLMLNAY